MKFEIDVSGSDIFKENFTICIANKDDDRIKGFKFKKELIDKILKNWKEGNYRYGYSDKQRAFLKVRLYCIIVYYLFKSFDENLERISLTICRDFHGHVNDINQSLRYLIENKLNVKIGSPRHQKLPKNSKAHWYAYMMHKDNANKLSIYVDIDKKDIEKFLIKKVTPKGR